VNELESPNLYEVAARASINERCASAYLHDIRGSMQALFSALELLGRSAKSGSGNPERVERACELARRAISHHEKSTLEALQILTLQHVDAAAVDVLALASEAVHFLRNDAANKHVALKVTGSQGVGILAERPRLQTALVGLLTAAIDAIPAGASLLVAVDRIGDNAVISIDSDAGYEELAEKDDLWGYAQGRLRSRELTLLFARQFLAANGGRLEIDAAATPRGAMHLYYPVAARNVAGAPADAALALP
jgi:hypothetical protein